MTNQEITNQIAEIKREIATNCYQIEKLLTIAEGHQAILKELQKKVKKLF